MFRTVSVIALVVSASAFAPSPRLSEMRHTAIFSEEPKWEPAEGMKWEEKDFEAEIKKLEKEATERLDEKVSDMMKNIESTGK
mmetsp:Transcript_52966/g.63775  ORF Transcript_52966/g.63775 Transcript_52966/m.63775 type:complete len:83 (-) Transcript_52966:200-448(-)|eukprot:CAMPEP_0172503926 /NCGR_PEP_ID=MMETSP1066-20121228/173776_1 /TAXON_ID=671091 /ORGANISM="Coscinodiscus wailesii, Strain CCMP2513" /LENGTH=82 /DNA_ID=CAMNT_0013279867 /DNA_START=171 /DNA_END=419 /DNA_ORIENTATION=+